jgi:phage gp45-like
VFVAGDRSNGVIIGTNDQVHRMKNLLPGEVAIYDDLGQSVYLTRNGIVVNGGGFPINVTNTPLVTMQTSLHVTGNIVADGDVSDHANKSMAGMRGTYNSHTHNDPQGGTVAAPNQAM